MPLEISAIVPYVAASALSFGLGIFVGIWIGARSDVLEIPNVQVIVALAITFIWAFSVASDIVLAHYSTSVLVHGIMGAVSGFLFTDEGFTVNIGK